MSFVHRIMMTGAVLAAPLAAQAGDETHNGYIIPDVAYEQFVLDNGLTVVVHEDRKAPIVAVNLWYHVGSKNEPEGRSGFAHLFEHLMFNGSEHFDDDYFQALEKVGATDLNGTTNRDRTNYFQNVPTHAIDIALWMESDRMGHLLGAIDQGKLDEQRGVVQNEKRQNENQPYGKVFNRITETTWPKGHPYQHTVIGSMDDLNAAEVEDIHEWFKNYYGPNNAVLVIAGDIDAATARAKVEHYFGDIPPGPPITKTESWVVKRNGEQRDVMEDRVPQARIYKVWNVPEMGTEELAVIDQISDLMGRGLNARLPKRLTYEEKLTTNVAAYIYPGEIGSQFMIEATAHPGGDLAAIEKIIDEELKKFLAEGPTQEELTRVKRRYEADAIRRTERVGGFGGKSDILAQSTVYGGSPDAYKNTMRNYFSTDSAQVKAVANEWLSDGVYVLEVHPYPALAAKEEGADRSSLPDIDEAAEARFPDLERAKLKNGLEIVLAPRTGVPLVNFQMLIDAGYASDSMAKPGTAKLAMNMLDEGTKGKSALEISEELALLGANLGSGSNLDMSSVSLSALKARLEPALDLFAEVILEPAFPENDLERVRKEQLAAIQREKVTPFDMALRVLPKLIYGEDHAYGLPFTGSGTLEAVSGMTRADLESFHKTWFKPNNATLLVTGDITMDEVKPLVENRFGKWRKGKTPRKNIATVDLAPGQTVYLVDRPQSEQSIVFASHLAPPKANPNEIAIETMNRVVGGSFTSRINMNLREDKGWAYYARSALVSAQGQRMFIAFSPVQTDKTADSMREIAKELNNALGESPLTEAEVTQAQNNLTLRLPGRWETLSAVMGSLSDIIRFGYEDDYWQGYAAKVSALDTDIVNNAADQVLQPEHLTWVIVGDRAKIEEEIKALGFGELKYLEAE